jgi:hypothetical protein
MENGIEVPQKIRYKPGGGTHVYPHTWEAEPRN